MMTDVSPLPDAIHSEFCNTQDDDSSSRASSGHVIAESSSVSKGTQGQGTMPHNQPLLHELTGIVQQDLSAFLYPQNTPVPGCCSGFQLPQGTTMGFPHSSPGTTIHQVVNVPGNVTTLPGGAGGQQFFPLPGEQATIMPAYIISSPGGQPFGQNPAFPGQSVQHIVISIPGGAGLSNTSNNMGGVTSYAGSGAFQSILPGLPSGVGTSSVVISNAGTPMAGHASFPSANQSLFGGCSLLGGSGFGGNLEGLLPGAKEKRSRPKKPRKQKVSNGLIPPKTKPNRSPTDRRYNSAPISLVATSRCEENEKRKLTGMGPMTMYLDCDTESLSEYQCFLRKQIEIFEANDDDLQWNAQKMNKGVVLGQVGLRCRHCTSQPPWFRTMGAVYYAATLDGLYQAGQNMSKNHISQCTAIPEDIRQELLRLKDSKRRASGGKHYWAEAARAMGVVEDSHGLRFDEKAVLHENIVVHT